MLFLPTFFSALNKHPLHQTSKPRCWYYQSRDQSNLVKPSKQRIQVQWPAAALTFRTEKKSYKQTIRQWDNMNNVGGRLWSAYGGKWGHWGSGQGRKWKQYKWSLTQQPAKNIVGQQGLQRFIQMQTKYKYKFMRPKYKWFLTQPPAKNILGQKRIQIQIQMIS